MIDGGGFGIGGHCAMCGKFIDFVLDMILISHRVVAESVFKSVAARLDVGNSV